MENRRVHPGDFHPSGFSSGNLRRDFSAGLAAVSSRAQAIRPLFTACVRNLVYSLRKIDGFIPAIFIHLASRQAICVVIFPLGSRLSAREPR
jgi:hypothetical protein